MNKRVMPKNSESFWLKTGHVNNYPQLEQDLDVDVAVIGGGIAGILSAYELIKTGKNVVLLEGHNFIGGTTGYTTSKLSAQHDIIYHELIQRHGEQKARSFYDANMEGIKAIREIAARYDIECGLREQNAYAYTNDESRVEEFKKEAEAYKQLNINGAFTDKLPIDVDVKAGIVMHEQYEFHPVKFLNGVLDVLIEIGVLIYENTLISEIEENDQVTLTTENGEKITCKQVICASLYPVDDPDSFYEKNMTSGGTLASIFENKGTYPGGMYISYDDPSQTIRSVTIEDDDYLLVGGQSSASDDDASAEERYEEIIDFATKTFDVGEVISYWSAYDYKTKDRMPLVGLNPSRQNIFAMTGFSKWGLANSATSAKLLCDLINGNKNYYESLYDPERDIPDIETNK